MTTNAINNQGMIEITSYITGDVIFEYRPTTEEIAKEIALRVAVETAVREGVSLAHAELADADLRNMDIPGADFDSAHLVGTKFFGSELDGVNFNRADLDAADLTITDVNGATRVLERVQECAAGIGPAYHAQHSYRLIITQ